jgi:hypothetical protein
MNTEFDHLISDPKTLEVVRVGSFVAYDQDGTDYTIDVDRNVAIQRHADGQEFRFDLQKFYTCDGDKVTRMKAGEFIILRIIPSSIAFGILVTSDSPLAE